MSIKEKEKQEAFRQMDKETKDNRTHDAIREELQEVGDANSDITKQKGTEAREAIDSQSYGRRKGRKGLNSPQ